MHEIPGFSSPPTNHTSADWFTGCHQRRGGDIAVQYRRMFRARSGTDLEPIFDLDKWVDGTNPGTGMEDNVHRWPGSGIEVCGTTIAEWALEALGMVPADPKLLEVEDGVGRCRSCQVTTPRQVSDGEGGQRRERFLMVGADDDAVILCETCLSAAALEHLGLVSANVETVEVVGTQGDVAAAVARAVAAEEEAAMVRAHMAEVLEKRAVDDGTIRALTAELADRDTQVVGLPERVAELETIVEGVRGAHVEARDQKEAWQERAESAEAALEETRRHDVAAESTTIAELQGRIRELEEALEARSAAKPGRRERASAEGSHRG